VGIGEPEPFNMKGERGTVRVEPVRPITDLSFPARHFHPRSQFTAGSSTTAEPMRCPT
jgi:hypothetical protein